MGTSPDTIRPTHAAYGGVKGFACSSDGRLFYDGQLIGRIEHKRSVDGGEYHPEQHEFRVVPLNVRQSSLGAADLMCSISTTSADNFTPDEYAAESTR